MMDPAIDFEALWAYVAGQFPLSPRSAHGPDHWRRVEANGLRPAGRSGGGVSLGRPFTVVRLFALFHDARRPSDGTDDAHGRRGADFAASLRGRLFDLPDGRFTTLHYACAWHEKGRVT